MEDVLWNLYTDNEKDIVRGLGGLLQTDHGLSINEAMQAAVKFYEQSTQHPELFAHLKVQAGTAKDTVTIAMDKNTRAMLTGYGDAIASGSPLAPTWLDDSIAAKKSADALFSKIGNVKEAITSAPRAALNDAASTGKRFVDSVKKGGRSLSEIYGEQGASAAAKEAFNGTKLGMQNAKTAFMGATTGQKVAVVAGAGMMLDSGRRFVDALKERSVKKAVIASVEGAAGVVVGAASIHRMTQGQNR